jgi:Fibronectin type III domain
MTEASGNGFEEDTARARKSRPQPGLASRLVEQGLDSASRSVTKWAYTALVLFAIAAVAATWFLGNVASLIITGVVVFGFSFAVYGFDRIQRSRDRFWQALGKALTSLILVSMSALFIWILFYIGTGSPEALDFWFRPGFRVETPAGVKAAPGGRKTENQSHQSSAMVRSQWPSDSFSGLASWAVSLVSSATVTSALAQARLEADPTTSITVTWDPKLPEGTLIELSIKKQSDVEFPAPLARVPADQGGKTITNLETGTAYQIKVNAVQRGRRSSPEIVDAATDAVGLLLSERLSRWEIRYTGPLQSNGAVTTDRGTITFRQARRWERDVSRWKAKGWIYRGGVKDGKPNGPGAFEEDANECGLECGTQCRGTFAQWGMESGFCKIYLGFITAEHCTRPGVQVLYGGEATEYVGEVGEPDVADPERVGPFHLAFSGKGRLIARARDYTDLREGVWAAGVLKSGRCQEGADVTAIGEFDAGQVTTGKKITSFDCVLYVLPVTNGAVSGQGALTTCKRIEVGTWIGKTAVLPFNGFSIERVNEPFTTVKWYSEGKETHSSRYRSGEKEMCEQTESFGLLDPPRAPATSDWRLSCQKNGDTISCTMEAPGAGILILAEKQPSSLAKVTIDIGANNKKSASLVLDGKRRLTVADARKPNNASHFDVLSELCEGAEVKNEAIDRRVSLAGFCPLQAIMFTRLIGCF